MAVRTGKTEKVIVCLLDGLEIANVAMALSSMYEVEFYKDIVDSSDHVLVIWKKAVEAPKS